VLGQPRRKLAGGEGSTVDVGGLLDDGLIGRQRGEQPVAQDAELQAVEDLVDGVAVPRLLSQLGDRHGEVEIADQLVDPTIADHIGQPLAQRLAGLSADLVDTRDDLVE
jgi:hypothetical protein